MPTQNFQVEGKTVSLSDKDYVAEGGFGKVFRKANIAYKIYFDPTTILPQKKIEELQRIKSKFVIKPDKTIFNASGPIGYTMPFLSGCDSLAKVNTNTFISANNISNDQLVHLVKRAKDLVSSVHDAQALIVDANEFNFMVGDHYSEMYAIDADGYQTPSFPATAIMESIRDFHAKLFSQKSDWYSFGIITFQLLTGIHPFKGGHPDFESVPKAERLKQRMLANVSVLNAKSHFPQTTRPFTNIPKNLLEWYKSIFESSERSAPPADFNKVTIAPTAATKYVKAKLKITPLLTLQEKIRDICYTGGKQLIWTDRGIYVDGTHHTFSCQNANLYCDGNPYLVENNSVYLLEQIGKIEAKSLVANLLDLPNSTLRVKNGILQNMCGSFFFFNLQGKSCYQIRLKELERGYRIISGKYERGVLALSVFNTKESRYDLLLFTIKGNTYDSYNISDLAGPDFHLAVNSAGVCLVFSGDDAYFFHKSDPDKRNIIVNCGVALDGLCSDGRIMVGLRGNTVFQISSN